MKISVRHFLFGVLIGLTLLFSFSYSVQQKSVIYTQEAIAQKDPQPPNDQPTATPATAEPTPQATIAASPKPSPTLPPVTPSPTPKPLPTPLTAPSDLEPLFEKYALEYQIDGQLLRRIAYCESRFNPSAENGIYSGLYQFSAERWTSYRQRMGKDPDPVLRSNAEESIKTASFIVKQGKLHLWPNCNQ